jgi:hypothetical protein
MPPQQLARPSLPDTYRTPGTYFLTAETEDASLSIDDQPTLLFLYATDRAGLATLTAEIAGSAIDEGTSQQGLPQKPPQPGGKAPGQIYGAGRAEVSDTI